MGSLVSGLSELVVGYFSVSPSSSLLDSASTVSAESTVPKEIANGTFAHFFFFQENRKSAHKNAQKTSKNFKLSINNVVSTGVCLLAVLGSQGIVGKFLPPSFPYGGFSKILK